MESFEEKAQKLYDKIGNIKKVAKELHTSYSRLRKFLKMKVRKSHPVKINRKRDTESYRNEVKKKMINYKGGKCQICGYNKCDAALDFHHIDPSTKEFNLSGGTKSFEKMKPELDKCILGGKPFLYEKRNLSTHPNPCCSRRCGGIKSHWKKT